MNNKLIRCSCKSSTFIHDMRDNLTAIINVKKDKNNKTKPIDVYCLECNKKYIVDEANIIVKYISKTIENYLKEV